MDDVGSDGVGREMGGSAKGQIGDDVEVVPTVY